MAPRGCFLPSIVCVLAFSLARPGTAQQPHLDILVQAVNGQLSTGTSAYPDPPMPQVPVTTLGIRVYSRIFPSGFAGNDPGFNSIGSISGTVPPGSSALPGSQYLYWDFLPMKVGGTTSNLLYWNGAGTTSADVSFGRTPTADYSLSLFDFNNMDRAAADGSSQLVPGHRIIETDSDGFIHQHDYFFLDNDHNDNNATVAVPGVYLIAMRLRISGLDRSDPFYIVWGTPGASGPSAAALGAAKTWVGDRADLLAPNFAADFDGDLDVDGADFLTWQRGLGASAGALQVQGDANHDHAINTADLAELRSKFGMTVATFPGATSLVSAGVVVPEPPGFVMFAGLLGVGIVGAGRLRPLASWGAF